MRLDSYFTTALWVLLSLGISLTGAVRPVSDFRVKEIGSFKIDLPSSKWGKTSGIKALAGGSSSSNDDDSAHYDGIPNFSTSITVSTTSSLPSSAPTIELSESVHIISTDDSEAIYYLNVTFDSSKTNYNETFPLLLDTGSADSWLYNESCSSDNCQHVSKFNDTIKLGEDHASTFSLDYSGDKVSGDLVGTTSSSLNVSIDKLSLGNFTFGLTSDSPAMFDQYDVSGIVGISSSSSSTNYVSQLYDSKIIDAPKFALSLVGSDQTIDYKDSHNNQATIPSNYGGLMVFGSQASKLLGKFTKHNKVYYTDVLPNENSYWLINVTSVSLHNDTDTQSLGSGYKTIIDTGTTGLALPKSDADDLHRGLFGSSLITDNSGNYAFLCNDTESTISFEINDHQFNLSSGDFRASEYSGNGLDGYCASKIQGIENDDFWILGAAFLSKYYTIFDLGNNRIGFGDERITTYSIKEGGSSKSGGGPSTTTSSSKSASKTSKAQATASGGRQHDNSTTSSSDKDSGATNLKAGLYRSIPVHGIVMLLTFLIIT